MKNLKVKTALFVWSFLLMSMYNGYSQYYYNTIQVKIVERTIMFILTQKYTTISIEKYTSKFK
jgi:hypothetical protein